MLGSAAADEKKEERDRDKLGGHRILKVHGDSRQVADCLTKIMISQAAHRRALRLSQMQQFVEHR